MNETIFGSIASKVLPTVSRPLPRNGDRSLVATGIMSSEISHRVVSWSASCTSPVSNSPRMSVISL